MKKVTEEFKKLGGTVEGEFNRIVKKPRKTLERFPTLFLLLTTAGIVLVLFGFERTFDKIAFFHNNPIVMIILGFGILIFTGKLYKKLDLKLDL